jgi:hypothetical protein
LTCLVLTTKTSRALQLKIQLPLWMVLLPASVMRSLRELAGSTQCSNDTGKDQVQCLPMEWRNSRDSKFVKTTWSLVPFPITTP